MTDFAVYKRLEIARISSSKDIVTPSQPVSQSHQREQAVNVANLAATLTEIQVGRAPYAANVASLFVTAALAEVANTTDYNVLTLAKRTGNGAAVTIGTANLANVAVTAFVSIPFTLVANAANTVVAAGDVITLANAKTGNGVANAATYTVDWVLEDIA